MDINYKQYLQLDKLLNCQEPVSKPRIHDELLFIITHQSFELWFKIVLDEIAAINGLLKQNKVQECIHHVKRITAVAELFPAKIRILETMSPQEFLKFRDQLMPASGLQSFQFRRVEFLMGATDEKYLKLHGSSEAKQLEEDHRKNLWDSFISLLSGKYKLETSSKDAQLKAIETVYNDNKYSTVKLFCEALIEADESFRKWRNAHALMAERMIGLKSGTGYQHTSVLSPEESFREGGVKYLKVTAEKKFFPLLWEVRTTLTKGRY